MSYTYGMKGAPAIGGGGMGLPRTAEIRGELLFTTPGTYLVTVPEGVTTMCAVVRSGSGGAFYNSFSSPPVYFSSGAGCGLAWLNNMPVTPLEQLVVVVGAGGLSAIRSAAPVITGGAGGESFVRDVATCRASGGQGGAQGVAAAGGSVTAGDGGGTGGSGAFTSTSGSSAYVSGGGAAGYSGNGGDGVANLTISVSAGNSGTGGAGGSGVPGAPSGGVGMFGEGPSGLGGTIAASPSTLAGVGKGGSSGLAGGLAASRSAGVSEDGAGGSINFQSITDICNGSDGAVRLIWGPGRSFPSTDVGQG